MSDFPKITVYGNGSVYKTEIGGFGTSYANNHPLYEPETPFKAGEKIFFVFFDGIQPSFRRGEILDVSYSGENRQLLHVLSCEEKLAVISSLCSRDQIIALRRADYAVRGALLKLEEDVRNEMKIPRGKRINCGMCKKYTSKNCKGGNVVCDDFT
jgi:hypothetical protein